MGRHLALRRIRSGIDRGHRLQIRFCFGEDGGKAPSHSKYSSMHQKENRDEGGADDDAASPTFATVGRRRDQRCEAGQGHNSDERLQTKARY